jgi:hypothetical protein
MANVPTEREVFGRFVRRLFHWTFRAGVLYVAAVAAAMSVWRLEAAWLHAAAIGVLAGAGGMYVRVRLLRRTATTGRGSFAPLSVLGQFAVLAAGMAAALLIAPAGLLAAAGGVVLPNILVIVLGLLRPAGSKA